MMRRSNVAVLFASLMLGPALQSPAQEPELPCGKPELRRLVLEWRAASRDATAWQARLRSRSGDYEQTFDLADVGEHDGIFRGTAGIISNAREYFVSIVAIGPNGESPIGNTLRVPAAVRDCPTPPEPPAAPELLNFQLETPWIAVPQVEP